MQDFKKLAVWQKSHSLAIAVYKVTSTFPKEEIYGLTSQIRRSTMSTPSNIAEGCGRYGTTDFGHFLQIALGSTCELEYQILLARDLKYMDEIAYDNLNNQVSEVRKMLISFIQKIKEEKG